MIKEILKYLISTIVVIILFSTIVGIWYITAKLISILLRCSIQDSYMIVTPFIFFVIGFLCMVKDAKEVFFDK